MAERVHQWLGLAGVAVVAVGFLGWQSVQTTTARGLGAPVVNPGLGSLMPYAAPLSDSLTTSSNSIADTIVLRRDPFSPQPPSRIAARPVAPADTTVRSRSLDEAKWTVSAILIGGARRAAIINDVLMHVGDTLPGGVTLTSVEQDRVVLTDSRGTAHAVAVKEGEGEEKT